MLIKVRRIADYRGDTGDSLVDEVLINLNDVTLVEPFTNGYSRVFLGSGRMIVIDMPIEALVAKTMQPPQNFNLREGG